MRKILIITTVFMFMAAGAAYAGISGTAHDLSGNGWGTDQLCKFCHTPHNANTSLTADRVPLWNHAVTSASFQVYSSPTLNASGLTIGGVSKACMSCHDGTVALDSYTGNSGTNFIGSVNANLGTDLRNDHPVGFTYNNALATADDGLRQTGDDGKAGFSNSLPLFGAGSDKMECATCHSVHDDTNSPFLRADNGGSALCLDCHDK
jgi:predicted CXXCH cytochrome family protein